MNKRLITLISVVCIVALGTLVAVYYMPLQKSSSSTAAIHVIGSFYPVAEFAKQVGQDKVEVTNLTPAGAEPHDFDPSPQDIVKLQNAKVFIYNGAGLEAWVDRVMPDLQKKGVVLVNASQGISLLPGVQEEADSVQLPTDPKLADPHIWLDPALAIQEVENIKEGLVKADPVNKSFYEANAARYQQDLKQLDQSFTQGLAQCQSKDIVTSHAAFGYLARHYGLNMVPISGLSPDEEPTPKRLAEIADFAKQHTIQYIFFETLVSPRLAETIAQEIGAKTIVFNPLEGLTSEEMTHGQNYITVQQQNLHNLQVALECS